MNHEKEQPKSYISTQPFMNNCLSTSLWVNSTQFDTFLAAGKPIDPATTKMSHLSPLEV